MSTFDITRQTGEATLDRRRQGAVRFSISNLSQEDRKVFISVVPRDAADEGLFRLDKAPQQLIEPKRALTIDVSIAAAPKTAAGPHTFTLKVADVDKPDVYYGESQPVEFVVPEVVEEPRRRHWWRLAAIAAAVILAVAAGAWLLRDRDEITFDQGYMLPNFVNDVAGQRVVLDDAKVLIYDKPLANLQPLTQFLQDFARASSAPLLIVANLGERARWPFELIASNGRFGDPTETGHFRVAAVALPGTGGARAKTLARIAELTGTRVVDTEEALTTLTLADLGTAARVVITDRTTTMCKRRDGGCE
jgi:hypothetical protein